MNSRDRIRFGYQIGAVGEMDLTDAQLYVEAMEDAQLLHELKYDAAWMVEHHFSDYYPQPNPLLFLSHVSAACPGLGLGTSVMVLPWYDPVRFAEDVAMLQTLSSGELHIGMGRGTAKSEYDAFGVPMPEARARFKESWEFTRLALRGEAVTFDGHFAKFAQPTKVRPVLSGRHPNFYGAIGSLESAEIMADLDLPPICLANFPDHLLARILERWKARTQERGANPNVTTPLAIKCFVGRTDEEAREEALRYLPKFFELQVEHYRSDTTPWGDIAGYEAFNKIFANLKKMCDPANLQPFLDQNLVGSPETVAKRLVHLESLGFNYFIITNGTVGVPRRVRHQTIRLFADEVIPRVLEAKTSVA